MARRYGKTFHSSRDENSKVAAERILRPLLEFAGARSMCDVGCGVGTWLRVGRELGLDEIAGIEGTWLDRSQLVIEATLVEQQDLNEPLPLARRFDLVVCLEVAEHLVSGRGPALIEELTRLSDLVLFGAAIPHQGGTGHVNEQWQSYWAARFDEQGYDVFDVVRPSIWNDEEIPFWYRQNTLLYAKRSSSLAAKLRMRRDVGAMLDVVHPALFDKYVSPRLVTAVRLAGRMARRSLPTRRKR